MPSSSPNLSSLLPAERVRDCALAASRAVQRVAEAGVFVLHYVLLASFAFPRVSESGPTMHPLLGIVNIVNAGGY